MKTPHPHKDLICQWAEDTSLQIEKEFPVRGKWVESNIQGLACHVGYTYRIKPKMLSLNGFEYPEPLKEAPPDGTKCWYAGAEGVYDCGFDSNRINCINLLKQRRLHLTREAAEMHFEAQIKAGGGEV
jgi:hypothetical protein